MRVSLWPLLGPRFPYFTVLLAVLLGTRFWGAGPGVLVLLAGAAGAAAITGVWDSTNLLLLGILGSLSIWTVEKLRLAYADAERNAEIADERLRQLREETERRTREESISAQLRAVVESSADAILSKDLNGVIQSWNLGAEEVFGYSASEAIGQHMSFLVPPERSHEEAGIMERIRSGGRVNHFETVRRCKGGKEIHVSLTVSPVLDGAQSIIGVSHIARDITEEKQFQEQLRQSQQLESLAVLAGGLAHDFNNLLTGIMGNASLAMHELGEGAIAGKRMAEILHASERAAHLVQQMLAYAGKGRFVIQPINLSAQVAQVVPLVRPSISRLVELDLGLDPSLPAVEADGSQMQQLILNLMINAAEAIGDRPGAIAVKTFGCDHEGTRHVGLTVKDTGCGMDTETRARIFDPFFTTKFTGRGLGLAAAMGIIRIHRGTIAVESAPGKGSTFKILLPAVMAESPPRIPIDSRPELGGYGSVPERPSPQAGA